jgi:hypothetical protein
VREFRPDENGIKMKGMTATAAVLVFALSLLFAAGSAEANKSGTHLMISCQYSYPGTSGPSLQPAPRRGCINTSTLNPVAVFTSSTDRVVRFCYYRAAKFYSPKSFLKKTWMSLCEHHRVHVSAGVPLYHPVPVGLGYFMAEVYSGGEKIAGHFYQIRPQGT